MTSIHELTAGDVMTTNLATLDAGERLDLAEDIMHVGRIRHMPVVEGKRLIGIVSVRDLLAALDSGQLAHASLDALRPEPLPPENPLWSHPKVTVMPHVARRPTVTHLATEITKNIRRLEAGQALLQEIDIAAGY